MPGEYPTMYQRARKESPECYTQEQAAELLYVSEKTMKAWEQGQRMPDNGTVARMAELYGTPWLALEHALETAEPLGVLPEGVCLKDLAQAVLGYAEAIWAEADRLRPLMRIAADNVVDDSERIEFQELCAGIRTTMAAGYQVLYAPMPPGILDCKAKRDRPVEATTKRSGFKDLRHSNDSKIIIAHRCENASPNLARGGGVLP